MFPVMDVYSTHPHLRESGLGNVGWTYRNAGTDAGVWIELLGHQLSSGRHALVDTSKDTFERGQVR